MCARCGTQFGPHAQLINAAGLPGAFIPHECDARRAPDIEPRRRLQGKTRLLPRMPALQPCDRPRPSPALLATHNVTMMRLSEAAADPHFDISCKRRLGGLSFETTARPCPRCPRRGGPGRVRHGDGPGRRDVSPRTRARRPGAIGAAPAGGAALAVRRGLAARRRQRRFGFFMGAAAACARPPAPALGNAPRRRRRARRRVAARAWRELAAARAAAAGAETTTAAGAGAGAAPAGARRRPRARRARGRRRRHAVRRNGLRPTRQRCTRRRPRGAQSPWRGPTARATSLRTFWSSRCVAALTRALRRGAPAPAGRRRRRGRGRGRRTPRRARERPGGGGGRRRRGGRGAAAAAAAPRGARPSRQSRGSGRARRRAARGRPPRAPARRHRGDLGRRPGRRAAAAAGPAGPRRAAPRRPPRRSRARRRGPGARAAGARASSPGHEPSSAPPLGRAPTTRSSTTCRASGGSTSKSTRSKLRSVASQDVERRGMSWLLEKVLPAGSNLQKICASQVDLLRDEAHARLCSPRVGVGLFAPRARRRARTDRHGGRARERQDELRPRVPRVALKCEGDKAGRRRRGDREYSTSACPSSSCPRRDDHAHGLRRVPRLQAHDDGAARHVWAVEEKGRADFLPSSRRSTAVRRSRRRPSRTWCCEAAANGVEGGCSAAEPP